MSERWKMAIMGAGWWAFRQPGTGHSDRWVDHRRRSHGRQFKKISSIDSALMISHKYQAHYFVCLTQFEE